MPRISEFVSTETKQKLRSSGKKKDNPKLIRKKIVDKRGKQTTVLALPQGFDVFKPPKGIGVRVRQRLPEQEKHFVTNKGKVVSRKFLDEEFLRKHPVTMKVLNEGKWVKDKSGKYSIRLSSKVWEQIIKEHEPLIHTVAKKYSWGDTYSDRYDELKQIGNVGLHEAINAYGKWKYKKKGEKPSIKMLVGKYVFGRVQEAVRNRLTAGVRIPAYLERPYQQYKEVKANLASELGRAPNTSELAEALSEIWTKNTFYPSYKLAEERIYGKQVVKKNGRLTTIAKQFSHLTDQEKQAEKEKDKLPMEGYVSLSKKGVVKDKLDKHRENLGSIQSAYASGLAQLARKKKKYENRTAAEIKNEEDHIRVHQELVDAARAELVVASKAYNNVSDLLSTEISSFEKILLNERPDTVRYNKAKFALKKYEDSKYMAERFGATSKPYFAAQEKLEQAKKELEQVKQLYRPIDEDEYERRLNQLRTQRDMAKEAEVKRYNNDDKSSRIPGILGRIREFERIETMKEVPLNVDFKDDEGDTTPNVGFVPQGEVLNSHEIAELREEHDNAARIMRATTDYLQPIYAHVFKLHTGMHETSKKTPDALWGELASDDEIQKYLDRRYKTQLSIPMSKFVSRLGRYNQSQLMKLSGTMPYVVPEYKDLRSFKKDYREWNAKKPAAKKHKVKVEPSTYRKQRKLWAKRKKKARMVWKAWRKKNKHLPQQKSVEKYVEIRNRFRSLNKHKPRHFEMRFVRPNKQAIARWKSREPKLFYESTSGKKKWISAALQDSKDIMTHRIPKGVVRDWLHAHRKLTEAGVYFSKALQFDDNENSKWTKFYLIRSVFEDIFGNLAERSENNLTAA